MMTMMTATESEMCRAVIWLERFEPESRTGENLFRALSNRYNKLLEIPVSYCKQMVGVISNRYKTGFCCGPISAFVKS